MCNRYVTPEEREIEDLWHVGRHNPGRWWDKDVFPRSKGVFIRRAKDDAGYSRELVAGQWGLVPWFAKEAKLKYPTNNARSEELPKKASYKEPWARGQRCIIPASAFDEPNWETGKNVWWRFRRADGLAAVAQGSGRGMFSPKSGAACVANKTRDTRSVRAAQLVSAACRKLYDEAGPWQQYQQK